MSDSRDVILNRMLNDIDSSYDKSKGQLNYDILSAVSIELESAYADNERKRMNSHIANATGKDLDELVKQYANMERKHATYSSGKVQIIGAVPGSTLYKGDFVSSGTINYECDTTVVADSDGALEVDVTCTVIGIAGNTDENTIIYFPKTLNGFSSASVTNSELINNGYNEETDEELRQRYYERVGDPQTSANDAMYRAWAKSITGVGDAKVLECWNGAGTLKIVIINSNYEVASEELINKVTEYILSVRPACSGELVVESATNNVIDIILEIDKDTNYVDDDIKKNIENSIKDYFKDESFKESEISYFTIANKIMESPGVIKIKKLLVNNSTSDISIGNTEIAYLGGVDIG